VTAAVKFSTCSVRTSKEVGDTVTDTTLGLELPHPDISSASPAAAANMIFLAVQHFMDLLPLISPRELSHGLSAPLDLRNSLSCRRFRTCG
jgi:hypothetical protein